MTLQSLEQVFDADVLLQRLGPSFFKALCIHFLPPANIPKNISQTPTIHFTKTSPNQQYKKYQQNVLVAVHVNPYTQLKNNTQNLKVLQTK